MTTTETPTVQLTMADRHRIAADVYAWNPTFTDALLRVEIHDDRPIAVQVYGHGTLAGRVLQIARDMLDDPTVSTVNLEAPRDTLKPTIHVQVRGTYRGVPMVVTDVLPDQADRDLIRDLPDYRVLDALAGDASREG